MPANVDEDIENRLKIASDTLGELFSTPFIAALAQATPVTAAIATYFSTKYAQDQTEALKELLSLMASKLGTIEQRYLDREFFETADGRRLAVQIVRSVLRDNRKEKIKAAANLAVNLHLKTKLSLDEKELFVTVLDGLNPLQLSILYRAVADMRQRVSPIHRGLGWEILQQRYAQNGVPKYLFLQAIRRLESDGLINQNNATVNQVDQTHFITEFGEQFTDFTSKALVNDSPYLDAT